MTKLEILYKCINITIDRLEINENSLNREYCSDVVNNFSFKETLLQYDQHVMYNHSNYSCKLLSLCFHSIHTMMCYDSPENYEQQIWYLNADLQTFLITRQLMLESLNLPESLKTQLSDLQKQRSQLYNMYVYIDKDIIHTVYLDCHLQDKKKYKNIYQNMCKAIQEQYLDYHEFSDRENMNIMTFLLTSYLFSDFSNIYFFDINV